MTVRRITQDDVEVQPKRETRHDPLPLWENTHTRSDNPLTSVQAASQAKHRARAHIETIRLALIAAGPMNAFQCDNYCSFRYGACGKRFPDLVRLGWIEFAGYDAPTDGARGDVYRITQKGLAAA